MSTTVPPWKSQLDPIHHGTYNNPWRWVLWRMPSSNAAASLMSIRFTLKIRIQKYFILQTAKLSMKHRCLEDGDMRLHNHWTPRNSILSTWLALRLWKSKSRVWAQWGNGGDFRRRCGWCVGTPKLHNPNDEELKFGSFYFLFLKDLIKMRQLSLANGDSLSFLRRKLAATILI